VAVSEVAGGEPEGEGRANWGAGIRQFHADCDAPALVDLLGGGEGFWIRAHAREALIDLSSDVVLVLIDALRHPNRRVRAGAGAALGARTIVLRARAPRTERRASPAT
jgi:hypothetical protein